MPVPRHVLWGLAILGCLALAAVYWLSLTSTFGTTYDEAVYILTGKALADGEGYRILSRLGDPLQIAYPPVYPALLALVWWLMPEFPSNVLAFKSLNIGFALLAVVMTYQLVVTVLEAPVYRGWMAAGMVALSSSIFILLDLAQSEMPFVLALIIAVRYLEPLAADASSRSVPRILAMAALATLPAMVRSIGVTLGVAVIGWFLLRREWKAAGLFTAAYLLCNLPWQLWMAIAKSSSTTLSFGYLEWYYATTNGLDPAFILGTISQNLSRMYEAMVFVAGSFIHHAALHKVLGTMTVWMVPLLSFVVFTFLVAGYTGTALTRLRIFHLFLLAYVVLLVAFPWPPVRYIAVLVPLMMVLFMEGGFTFRRAASALPLPGARQLATIATLLILSLGIGNSSFEIFNMIRHGAVQDAGLRGPRKQDLRDGAALSAWAAEHLPPNAVWIAECDPCVYLLTKRKTLLYTDGQNPTSASRAFFNQHPTYILVNTDLSVGQQAYQAFLTANAGLVEQVFQGPEKRMTVYRLSRQWPIRPGE